MERRSHSHLFCTLSHLFGMVHFQLLICVVDESLLERDYGQQLKTACEYKDTNILWRKQLRHQRKAPDPLTTKGN